VIAPTVSIIEIVQYERWFFARCITCHPARNVSPKDRKTEDAAVADAKTHALEHLASEQV
jgi:hypothetical protein